MAQTIDINPAKKSVSSTRFNAGALKIAIRDTSDLKKKIDLSRYADIEKVNPTSLVIVDQFPKAGEQVPQGTPVTLTFMSKDSIPVKDIVDLSDAVKGKYQNSNIKKITDDIWSEDEIKKILTDNKDYVEMSATEKEAVKKYAVKKGIVEAEPDDTIAGSIYNDLAFIYHI